MITLILFRLPGVVGFGYWFKYLNLSHLKSSGWQQYRPNFKEASIPELLKKISLYTIENSRAGLVESVVNNVLLIGFSSSPACWGCTTDGFPPSPAPLS